MKPASFEYFQAHSIAEAVALLAEHGDEGKVLAGGQSLVPTMNFRLARPAVLIDLNPISELARVNVTEGGMTIGSMVRHRVLERGVGDGPVSELLSKAGRHVGHLPIRIRGTFGGSLAHADPAAEWCVIAALLDAEIITKSESGTRTIQASDFFQTVFTTALRSDELVTEIRLGGLSPTAKVGFSEFSRRAGDFALTMAAVAVEMDGSTVSSARIALGGVSDRPVRATSAESHLNGRELNSDRVTQAAQMASEEIEPLGDIHGSAEYRRDLMRVLTERALEQVSGE